MIYNSIGSNSSKLNTSKSGNQAVKKAKINVKKSSGLMPRGNTLDNRYHQNDQKATMSKPVNIVNNVH